MRRTALCDWPTTDFIGYSATDQDNEYQSSAALPNEPLQLRQMILVDGHPFYYANSTNCSGWVDGNDVALCSSKQEWLDAWQVGLKDKDFVVVTESMVQTQASATAPSISKVELQLGTILKLVPDDQIPTTVGGRATWHNYVVYLPTRNDDGSYVRRMALVPERASLSEGFLPLTQRNVLDVALSCQGDRYGWGGCQDAMDCTLYAAAIYRCFGFNLPRNTTGQPKVPGVRVELAGLSDPDKQALIETFPAGTLPYFSGHVVVYLGSVDGVGYVISDVGNLYPAGDDDAGMSSVYDVAITPLTMRRGGTATSGETTSRRWLTHLNEAVVLAQPVNPSQAEVSVKLSPATATYNGKAQAPKVSVSSEAGMTLSPTGYRIANNGGTNAGTYDVTVQFDSASVSGVVTKRFTIAKASQTGATLGTSGTTVTGCSSRTGKLTTTKKLTLKASGVKGKAPVTWKKASGSSYLTVGKTGTLYVKKGIKKGSYKIKVTASLAATKNYKAKTVSRTFTIRVR
ncbi:MAG: NlpC/P60 family protein [Coriobacteriia bacterium]|nr:NlpC/P60 family protein [Coriobacteriia bacterium]